MAEVIELPYKPRPLQEEYHNRTQRWAITICHRRFGKTVMVLNDLVRDILTCPLQNPRGAYIAPLYKQAKAVAWDYLQQYTRAIPGMQFNQSELRADFPNGGRISLYGADNPDSLRGIYLDAVALDEFAQMSEAVWDKIIRPVLSDREGRATFIGTPEGHNAFFKIYEQYKNDPEWFTRIHRASETGYVAQKELDDARKQMSEDAYAQEYECSWTAAIQGSYYGRLLEEAERKGRIKPVNADPGYPVHTAWDLGIGDSTAIWFWQHIGPEYRFLDYYEASGEALSHYANVLIEKQRQNRWTYGEHVLPHDARQRSLDTGKSRVDSLAELLGDKPIVQQQHKVEDGIEAVRRMLPNSWFDEVNCYPGLNALRHYRAEYDDVRRTYRLRPVHDWASHGSDAFRVCAMHKSVKAQRWEPIQYSNKGIL